MAGSTPPAVFFHDCREGGAPQDWAPLRDRWPTGDTAAPALPLYAASPPQSADDAARLAQWRAESEASVDEWVELTRRWSDPPILLGAGCGGFFALLLAERIPIAGLVTLSGMADQHQLAMLMQQQTPVYAVAAEEDESAPARTRTIANVSFSLDTRHVVVPGTAHGTDLLTPELCDQILHWAAGLPAPIP